MVWDAASFQNHDQVTYVTDEETGLRAIIAVHDTTLGPALGGSRMYDYADEDAALRDALRLSRAMSYKAAAADLDLGGGKAVIYGDPDELKDERLLRAYARGVDDLGGKYLTSVDVGTGVEDMDVIKQETEHVVGTSDGLGDPSPITAHGVFHGLRASAEYVYGRDSLSDRHVAVQGIGKVGGRLAELLAEEGATVTVTDTSDEAVEAFADEYENAHGVAPDEIYDVSCDIFAPCAIGGVINDETVPRLDCGVVAGAANNILDERRHAGALQDRNILYLPDYVINAGGLITVAKEHTGGTREQAYEEAEAIGDRLLTMLDRAEGQEMTVLDAADEYAEDRIESGDRLSVTP